MNNEIFSTGQIVSILTTQPINGLLDYFVNDFDVQIGQYVVVPFGSREVPGVVWEKSKFHIDIRKIKKISKPLPVPHMKKKFINFLIEVAELNICSINQVLKLTFIDLKIFSNKQVENFFSLENINIKDTKKIKELVNLFNINNNKNLSLEQIQEEVKISKATIEKYCLRGLLKKIKKEKRKIYPKIEINFSNNLTIEQKKISDKLRNNIKLNRYKTTLLYGVTGSGKTEVYLDAISEALALGKQVLVLLPEISLTISFLERFEKRFRIKPSEWHSNVSKKERKEIFYAVSCNKIKLIIGARSALFLPFSNLGLVIVDEEHDSSYKQEDGVCYNARDMSVLRAYKENANVILASATPSLESWYNAKKGKYEILRLKHRFKNYLMPNLFSVDMNSESLEKGRWISYTLERAIKKRIEKKQQTLLFLNKRGYAPITLCNNCGYIVECKNCDTKLVYHNKLNLLVCHQCGIRRPILKVCGFCKKKDTLKSIGPGVERIAEECLSIFPDCNVKILSSDLMLKKDEFKNFFQEIKNGNIDIIIGTQLASKGHNFPLITLVGVIDGDIGVQGIDLRSTEKSFQMIRQVVGRAGRDGKKSEGFIQTWNPNHPLMTALLNNKDEEFIETELAVRKRANAPPFSRFISLILSGNNERKLMNFGYSLSRNLNELFDNETYIFGPALAPISKIKSRFRIRLLIKTKKHKKVLLDVFLWKKNLKIPNSVRLTIDVDPYNFN